MSCIQVTYCRPWPSINVSKSSLLPGVPFKLCCLPIHYNKLARNSHVCSFGGKGQPKRDTEGSPWKSSEEAMGSFKENSIEDVLRKQIAKQEYDDGGGGGGGGDRSGEGKPPRGGGGGGGDGGSGDGSEDDPGEFLEVFLATSGLILLYLWIIINQDGRRLVLDSIICFFFGRKSIRLQKSLEPLERQLDDIYAEETSEEVQGWLEAAILETSTHYRTEDAVATQYSEEEAAPTKGYYDEGEEDEDDENEDKAEDVDVDMDVDEEDEEEDDEDDDDEDELNFLDDYDKDSSDDEATVVIGKDSDDRVEYPIDRAEDPYDRGIGHFF